MPAVVAFIATTGVEIAGISIATSTILAYTAVIAYGSAQRRKARRKAIDAYNASLQDRLVMQALADGRRSRVYGRVRNVDGVVFKQTHGTNSEFYTFVVSLAGHEVDAIETVYFNDVAISMDGNGYVTTAPWSGSHAVNVQENVTITAGAGFKTLAHTPITGTVTVTIGVGSGDLYTTETVTPSVAGADVTITGLSADGTAQINYQWLQDAPKARVRKYLGGASQDLSTDLMATVGSSLLTSADKFAGDASLIVTLEYDQDAFPTGVPNISAVMRGAKCIDPRNPSAAAAWTQNPAVIAYDWATYAYGGGASADELVTSAFIAAANACDVSTTFTTTAGNEVRPLYECGIVCPLDADPSETMEEIVESMAGKWGWAGGKLTLRAGVIRAAVADITEAWVSDKQAINILPQAGTADLINVQRPTIADADQDYVAAPTAEVRYAAAITADGRELPRESELRGVTRKVHAQHVCGVLMREAREGLTLQLPCKLHALGLELFDIVTVTLPAFGFNAKLFEVIGWSFTVDSAIVLTLRETTSLIFDPDASFDVLDYAPNTELPDPSIVEQVDNVQVTSGTSATLDKSILVRTTVTWDAVVDQAVRQSGRIEVQYTEASTALPTLDWPSITVDGNATSAQIIGLRAGVHYLFRVRAKNTIGVRGRWSTPVLHQVDVAPDANGSTVVVEETSASGVSVTGQSGSPTGTFTTVASYTFTPSADGYVNVEFEGECTILTNSTNTGASDDYATIATRLRQDGTSLDASAVRVWHFQQQVGLSKTVYIGVSRTRRVDVVGGVSTTIDIQAQRLSPTATTSITGILRTEYVKLI